MIFPVCRRCVAPAYRPMVIDVPKLPWLSAVVRVGKECGRGLPSVEEWVDLVGAAIHLSPEEDDVELRVSSAANVFTAAFA